MSQRLNEHQVLATALADALNWAEEAYRVVGYSDYVDDEVASLVQDARLPIKDALRAVQRVIDHEQHRTRI